MRTVKPQKNPKTFYIFDKENKGTVKTYTTSVWPRSTNFRSAATRQLHLPCPQSWRA